MADWVNHKRKILAGWVVAALLVIYRLSAGIVVQPLQLVLMFFYTVLLALLAAWKLRSLRRQVRSALT
jgi:hypothetical protein